MRSVAFSPGDKLVASGSSDEHLRLWDAETGDHLLTMKGHWKFRHFRYAFSPDGKHLLSGSYDQSLRLWDTKTGAQLLVD